MLIDLKKDALHFFKLGEMTRLNWGDCVKSLCIVLGAGVVGYILVWLSSMHGSPATYNASILFILATLIAALQYGFIPGLFSAAMGFFGYHFFFQYPQLSFTLDTTNEGVNLTLFMASALFAAIVGSHSRRRLNDLKKREQRIVALHKLYEHLVFSENKKEVVHTLEEGIANILHTNANIILPDKNADITQSLKEIECFSLKDCDLVLESWKNKVPVGLDRNTNLLQGVSGSIYSLPMITASKDIGVLVVHMQDINALDNFDKKLAQLLADQSAVAIEHAQFSKIIEDERNLKEREELRSALLSSVTHDLKTPLVSIIGSLSAILKMPEKLKKEDQLNLIQTSHDEAERLNSFISNILSVTKLESGSIVLHKEWVSVKEMIKDVLKRMKHRIKNHNIIQQGESVDIMVDVTMMEQVVQNLVDNAVKYSSVKSDIIIDTAIDQQGAVIRIIDYGRGVPEESKEQIFDKFFRITKRDHRVAGTGLGLSICKTILLAHDGSISVSNNNDDQGNMVGSIFTIYLPKARVSNQKVEKK